MQYSATPASQKRTPYKIGDRSMTSHANGQNSYIVHSHSTADEKAGRARLVELMKSSPIPDAELPANVPLYTNRQTLSHVLYMEHLYRLILPVHGVIVELG